MHKALIVSIPQGQPCSWEDGELGCQPVPGGIRLPKLSQPGQAEEIKHRNTDDLT